MHCLFGIIGELCFIVGIILNFWAFLSPTPWYSNDVTNSMLYFTPYNEPVGYVAPNPCGSAPLSNSTVSITYGAETNPINYGDVAVWMGPFGMCRSPPGVTSLGMADFTEIVGSGSQVLAVVTRMVPCTAPNHHIPIPNSVSQMFESSCLCVEMPEIFFFI